MTEIPEDTSKATGGKIKMRAISPEENRICPSCGMPEIGRPGDQCNLGHYYTVPDWKKNQLYNPEPKRDVDDKAFMEAERRRHNMLPTEDRSGDA